MSIFETLKELSDNQRKKESKVEKIKTFSVENSKRKEPSYIYLDDNNQIKEKKLSELLDSSASVYINRTMYKDSLKLIHDSIFH